MAKHQFGIMERAPVHGERYDRYEPEAYALLSVDDEWIEPLLPKLDALDFFWHSLDVPGKGLAYYGITLIPPRSMEAMSRILEDVPALSALTYLLAEAKAGGKFVIHYGI